MSNLSFYVHIPYCVKRCGYCDFNTYTPAELREGGTLETVSQGFVDSLIAEVTFASRTSTTTIPTIFFWRRNSIIDAGSRTGQSD